jgi:hypothetical protein
MGLFHSKEEPKPVKKVGAPAARAPAPRVSRPKAVAPRAALRVHAGRGARLQPPRAGVGHVRAGALPVPRARWGPPAARGRGEC